MQLVGAKTLVRLAHSSTVQNPIGFGVTFSKFVRYANTFELIGLRFDKGLLGDEYNDICNKCCQVEG